MVKRNNSLKKKLLNLSSKDLKLKIKKSLIKNFFISFKLKNLYFKH